jgi:AcrR family transcriptional regulator
MARFIYDQLRTLPRSALAKVPQQERSIATVHDILDAAERALATEGPEQFTTHTVAAVAGMSPGSIYQYFANKDMIIAGVLERASRHIERLAITALANSASQEPDVFLRSFLGSILDFVEENREMLAVVANSSPGDASQVFMTGLETRMLLLQQQYTQSNRHRIERVGGSADFLIVLYGCTQVTIRWLSNPGDITRDNLMSAIERQIGTLFRPVA